ncbi:MAG: GTP cyclohydrolase I FolE2 [Fretibacterium sp.]|nr:GTP cyclohydrolase I FolE2 [Fretibacterium sp.]
MKDVQGERDFRNIPINRVGVRNVYYPILVVAPSSAEGENVCREQSTVASVSMSVLLPHEFRGTHMSRFIETLEKCHGRISLATLPSIARGLRDRLDAPEAALRFDFPYFIRKSAPVSKNESFMRYEVSLEASSRGDCSSGEDFDMIIGVGVPVQTLCPCSREIAEHGAHNQRALISLRIRCAVQGGGTSAGGGAEGARLSAASGPIWFEELIRMAEDSASAPLFTLLKREDEKFVTERAYENPKFVEDVVRDLTLRLNAEPRITWYAVSVVSSESIHNHDAFAEIVRDKR